jgi:hypothetical protein
MTLKFVVAVIAAALVGGGYAFGSIPDSTGLINACYDRPATFE